MEMTKIKDVSRKTEKGKKLFQRENFKSIQTKFQENSWKGALQILLTPVLTLVVFLFLYIPQSSATDIEENLNIFGNCSAEKQVLPETVKNGFNFVNTEFTGTIPENWGSFNGSNLCSIQMGSSNVAHSGKFSCFLKVIACPDKKIPLYVYLMIGNTDGYDGKSAIIVNPDTEYAYSFWLKGNIDEIGLTLFTWSTTSGTKKRCELIPLTSSSNKITNEWTKIAGTFKTSFGIDRIAIGVQIIHPMPEHTVFVDDVLICEKPSVSFKKKSSSPKVAIYDSGSYNTNGCEYVRSVLNDAGYKASVIDSLARNVINEYDVIILSTTKTLSIKDEGNADLKIPRTDYVSSLLNFVDEGGGVILGHDCVGFRGIWEVPIFPALCSGNGRMESRNIHISSTDNPVTKDVDETFEHSYSDHITVQPGPQGTVLATDNNGSPVIVSGKISRGKIVAIGYPMGLSYDNTCRPLLENEKRILLNAINWVSSSDKYNVPQILTDVTLYKDYYKSKQMLVTNEIGRQKEELIKYSQLPPPHFDGATMWVMANFDSEEKVVKMVENCKKMGFDEILIQAISGLKCFVYKSDIYPECTPRTKNKMDLVEIVRRETKKRGMKMGLMLYPFYTGTKDLPMVVTPEERMSMSKNPESISKILEKKSGWNCPSHPLCQTRFFTICEELIRKYHPDEMNFDFVRFPTGYKIPCHCGYCMEKKEQFRKAHPDIKAVDLNEEFAKEELMTLYTKVNELCKKLSPELITSCYTYDTDWVFSYPFDYHTRYVSRFLSPTWPLDRIETDTVKYSNLMQKYNPNGYFVPMLSSYDIKTGKRIYTELSLLSQTFDKIKAKHRSFIYYDYTFCLVKDPKTGELYEDVAEAFSNALGGNWENSSNAK